MVNAADTLPPAGEHAAREKPWGDACVAPAAAVVSAAPPAYWSIVIAFAVHLSIAAAEPGTGSPT